MNSVQSLLVKGSAKAPTGIAGFDEITGGGLPRGRTTLLVGGPGSGKTILALQFLVHGARNCGEPGIFVAFEETAKRIVANAESFGWKLAELQRKRLFFLDAQPTPDLIQSAISISAGCWRRWTATNIRASCSASRCRANSSKQDTSPRLPPSKALPWFDRRRHVSVGNPDPEIFGRDAGGGVRVRTLLCVDDHATNLKLIKLIVSGYPEMRLLTAVNGNSGIQIARESQPEVILMDINLPDINGFKALEILRSDPATAQIPVIALSANVLPLNIESGLEAGFFRYLTKPLKANEFMDALKAALELRDKRAVRANERGRRSSMPPAGKT
jgi:CheY-like chemotaxis protein